MEKDQYSQKWYIARQLDKLADFLAGEGLSEAAVLVGAAAISAGETAIRHGRGDDEIPDRGPNRGSSNGEHPSPLNGIAAMGKAGRRRRGNQTPNDPAKPKIVDPLLDRLFGYWNKQRGFRLMPSRADIDPVEMRFILGHLMLIDVQRPPLEFRIRLQGTKFAWWVGGEFTGRMLDELPSPELRALAREYLTTVVETRAPFHNLGDRILDGIPRRFEVLILPLSGSSAAVDMLLGAVRCRDRLSEG
jgi:hypothetical protein